MDHQQEQEHAQTAGEKPARILTDNFHHTHTPDIESAATICSSTPTPTQRSPSWVTGPWIRRARVWIRWHMERTWGLTSHAIDEPSLDSHPLSASSTSSASTLVDECTIYARHHQNPNQHGIYSPKKYAKQATKGSGWSPSSSKGFSSWRHCVRIWNRRQWRTVLHWVWVLLSIALLLILGAYVAVVALRQGHIFDNPGQEERHAEQNFSGANGHIPDDILLKDYSTPVTSPEASSDTTNIWLRPDEPMDIYPDEDEDEAAESLSFVSWLTQAFTPFMEQSRMKNKGGPYQQAAAAQTPTNQETFSHEPVRYFTYKPYAGFSNQFYGMLRAMQIAKRLNRTLLIPPITSSNHDMTRRNQAWSEFFDLDEFQAKTGLRVIEYHDLRDKGGFRGPTGVRESGTSLGGYWVPPHLTADPNNDLRYGRPLETPPKRVPEDHIHSERYQHSFGTGTGSVDMSFPCHVTCGFGSKRSLDYTAKGFMRQWGFEIKTLTLPTIAMSENATDNANLPTVLQTKALPMDQTRDYNRIIQALEHETLRDEPFLCITNTYKIQLPRGLEDLGIGSFEFSEYGQFLKFQPKVVQFVDEYLEKVLGKSPESRVVYPKDTFWTRSSAPAPLPASVPLPAPVSPLTPADNQPVDSAAPHPPADNQPVNSAAPHPPADNQPVDSVAPHPPADNQPVNSAAPHPPADNQPVDSVAPHPPADNQPVNSAAPHPPADNQPVDSVAPHPPADKQPVDSTAPHPPADKQPVDSVAPHPPAGKQPVDSVAPHPPADKQPVDSTALPPADKQPVDSTAPLPPAPVQQTPQDPIPVSPIRPATDPNANQGSQSPPSSGTTAPSLVSTLQEHPIKHTYFMLHVRRGDFEIYCRDTFDGLKLTQCLPTNEKYVKMVRELQRRARSAMADGGSPKKIPVFVATNDNSPEKLQELRELGLLAGDPLEEGEEWKVINHTEMQTVATLGPFGPQVFDQIAMSEAEAVLGVKMSTFSRVAEYRQRDWYGRRILYV